MNIKYMGMVLLLATSLTAWGQVNMRTTVRDVFFDGSCEQAGSIEWVVDSEVFPNASPENPIYIAIRFDKGTTLCKTRVWTSHENPDPRTQLPIYLPISFEKHDDGSVVTAPADSVSVVRWKAGESRIWLKVQRPAGDWINLDYPNSDNRLRFGLGFSASTYWEINISRFEELEANLPCTTRNIDDPLAVTEADAVSALLCLDYSNSNLQGSPWNPETQTIGNFRKTYYDATSIGIDGLQAVASESDIVANEPILILIGGYDNPISKGINQTCESIITSGGTQDGSNSLCGDELVPVPVTGSLDISCINRWGWHVGSEIIFHAGGDGRSGFPVQVDDQGQPLLDEEGRPLLNPTDFTPTFGPFSSVYGADLFTDAAGNLLATTAKLIYDGPNTLGGIRIGYTANVYRHPLEGAAVTQMQIGFRSSNRDPVDVFDFPPFDGIDQARRCDPAFQDGEPIDIATASFEECAP